MTRDDLADLLSVSVSEVSSWERARSAPQAGEVAQLAAILAVPRERLMREVDLSAGLGEFRVRAGLTQADAAHVCGLRAHQLGAIERGHKRPTDQQLRLLASMYGIAHELAAAAIDARHTARLERTAGKRPRCRRRDQG